MHQVQDSLFALPPRKEGRWLSKIFSVVRTPNAPFETNLFKYLRHCLDALRSIKTCRSDPQPSHLCRKVLHSCLPHAVGIFRRQVISSCREHSLLSQVLVSAALRIHVVIDNACFCVKTIKLTLCCLNNNPHRSFSGLLTIPTRRSC